MLTFGHAGNGYRNRRRCVARGGGQCYKTCNSQSTKLCSSSVRLASDASYNCRTIDLYLTSICSRTILHARWFLKLARVWRESTDFFKRRVHRRLDLARKKASVEKITGFTCANVDAYR